MIKSGKNYLVPFALDHPINELVAVHFSSKQNSSFWRIYVYILYRRGSGKNRKSTCNINEKEVIKIVAEYILVNF
jgi:hypothetical protein